MWKGYKGNRLPPCFPTDVYDRNMATDIWLFQPYVIAWEKARPYVIAWKKDLSYTWYIRVYTKYYTGIYPQYTVYKRIRWYIPGLYKYIRV